MPPHRVAAVLRTLAPNSIPRLSPPRATHPQLSPWPSFSLVAAAATTAAAAAAAARSHTPRTPRFSTKLSRRASGHADPPLPLYLSTPLLSPPPPPMLPRSYYHYSTPVAITFGASTFTSSNSTMCCLRRVSAELPSSFQIQPLSLCPSPSFPSFHSDSPLRPRGACHPFLRIYPARFLLRFSFKFHPTFSTQPHRSSRRRCYRDIRCIYISRARLLLLPCHPPLYLFLSLARFLSWGCALCTNVRGSRTVHRVAGRTLK